MKTLIVGNGPAGISAARALSAGSTVLIAPQDLPRPGVCGGVLTPPTCEFLRRFDMVETLLENGARRLESVEITAQRRHILTMPLEQHPMLSLPRERFDRTLFHHWVPSGVQRHVGYVRGIETRTDGIEARLRDGSAIRADGVVDATGHRRLCSGNGGSGRALMGTEWTGSGVWLEDRLYLAGFNGGYAGITPTSPSQTGEENRFTVSAVFDTGYFQEHGPEKAWRKIRRNLTSSLRDRLPRTPPGAPRTKAGFWNEVNWPIGERWVAVGDAAGFTMPLTGEGIWMALREGHLAGSYLSGRSPAPVEPPREQAAGWPLSRSDRTRLGGRLVEPFQRQTTRWKLTHFLGTHPRWITTVHRLLPGFTGWLVKKLFPASSHWNE